MKIVSAKKLFEALLLILLSGQIFLIYSTFKDKGLNIAWLIHIDRVNEMLPKNTQLQYGEILFYLPFKVRLSNPILIYADIGCHKYEAEYLDISWTPFIKNNYKLDQWTVHSNQGALETSYYPKKIEAVNLAVHFNKEILNVAHFSGQSEDKFFSLALKTKPQYDSGSIKADFNLPSNKIESFLNCIYISKNTNLFCDIDLSEPKYPNIGFTVATESFQLNNLHLENSQVTGLVEKRLIELSIKASKISHSTYALESLSPEAQIRIEDGELKSIGFDLHSIKANSLKLDHAFGAVKTANEAAIKGNALLGYKEAPAYTEFHYDLKSKTLALDIESYLNNALILGTLKELKIDFDSDNYLIKDPNPIFLKVDLMVGSDLKPQKAEGRISVNAISLNQVHFDHLSSAFVLEANGDLTSKTHLRTKRGPADIEAEIDNKRGSYLFTIEGFAVPNDLNSVLPEWWKNTFIDFTFTEDSKSWGEFAVLGLFKNPIPSLFIGRAMGSDILYKDVMVKTSDLFVRGSDYITEIQIKKARTEDGQASGKIQLAVKPDGFPMPESVQLDLISELSLEDSQALFGKNIKTIISHFETNATPLVRLDSVIFNDHYTEHKDKSYYNLNISTHKPFLFMDRPFEDLNIEAYGRENNHYLRSAVAAFSKGTLNFNADITETDSEDPQLRIDLEIIGSDSRLTAKNLLKPTKPSSDLDSESNAPIGELSLNAILESKGSLLDISNHNGSGQLDISGKGLAQIHLLGPFSKALNDLKIPIGSFGLNKLNTKFIINKEIINVTELEINGDQTQVLGSGTYSILDQSINFDIEVDLLKNTNLSFANLGILGNLFNPITELLSFNVSGSPEDQIWRSRFDPRNLFE